MKLIFTKIAAALLLCYGQVFSQTIPPPCPSNFYPPADNCAELCVYCNLTSITSQTAGYTPNGVPGFCGTIENEQWMAFVAAQTNITVRVTANSCTDGNGVQLAIFNSECGSMPIACYGGQSGGGSFPIEIQFTAVVGQTYFLMVDGFAGDQCDFTLQVLPVGAGAAPPLGTVGQVQGPASVCPNGTFTYTIPNVNFASSFVWNAPADWLINGQQPPVVISGSAGTSVEVQTGSNPGSGSVCVQASNSCFFSPNRCKTVNNQPIPTTTAPTMYICSTDVPYDLCGNTVLDSDEYTCFFNTATGCDSMVVVPVEVVPPIVNNLGIKYLCTGQSLQVCGQAFSTAGNFSQTCTSTTFGCDSTINFSIVVYNQSVAAITATPASCNSLPFTLSSPVQPNVSKSWFDPAGNLVGTGESITATVAGLYTLQAVVESSVGATCTFSSTYNVQPAPSVVISAASDWINICQPQPATLSVFTNPPATAFAWSGPNGFSSNLQNPTTTAAGAYTVVATLPNGCTLTDTATVQTFGGPPPTYVLAADTLSCCSPSANISVSGNAPFLTYAWLGPNGFTSNLEDLVVNFSGNYTLTATDTFGCSTTKTVEVASNLALPNIAATAQNLTCSNPTATLVGSSTTSVATFLWIGPNGFTSTQAIATTTVTGDYTLQVFSPSNCCTASLQVQVLENKTPPAGQISIPTTLTCSQPTTNLQTISNPNFAYNWTTNTGQILSGNSTPEIQVGGCGNYFLTITDLTNGCTSTASRTVACDFAPPAISFVGDSAITCSQPMPAPQPIAMPLGTDFQWIGAAPPFATTGIFTVVGTAPNGCTASQTIQILENTTPPTFQFFGDSVITCSQPMVSPMPVAAASGVVFVWTNAAPPFPAPGVFGIVATAANGCTASQMIQIFQNTSPPNFQILGNPTLTCSQPTTVLTPSPLGAGIDFKWEVAGALPNSPLEVSAAGEYTLVGTGANGCTASQSATVVSVGAVQTTLPPIFVCSEDAGEPLEIKICGETETVVPSQLAGGVASCTVKLPSGCDSLVRQPVVVRAAVFTQNPPATVCAGGSIEVCGQKIFASGDYEIVCTAVSGCDSVVSGSLVVLPPMSASATAEDLTCCSPFANINLTTNSPATEFSWMGPGGFSSDEQNPKVIQSGTYFVIVKDANGCSTTTQVTVLQRIIQPVFATGGIQTCDQREVILNCSNAPVGASFAWTGPGNFSSNLQNPTVDVAGIYEVVVFDASTCCTASTNAMVADSCLISSGEITGFKEKIMVYPNVAINAVVVETSHESGLSAIGLFDATGRQMIFEKFGGQRDARLDVRQLPEGVYFLKILIENRWVSRRLVVAR